MNLSIDPSNPGELIQETDKDMNKRSSILPIQLTTKTHGRRSMLMGKRRQSIYSLFC